MKPHRWRDILASAARLTPSYGYRWPSDVRGRFAVRVGDPSWDCRHCGSDIRPCLTADQPCCPDCHHGGSIRHRATPLGEHPPDDHPTQHHPPQSSAGTSPFRAPPTGAPGVAAPGAPHGHCPRCGAVLDHPKQDCPCRQYWPDQ